MPSEQQLKGRKSVPAQLAVRVPPDLARAVEQAAAKELISVSDYARRAMLRSVQRDGIEVV